MAQVIVVPTARYSVYEVATRKSEPEPEPKRGTVITDVKTRLVYINLIQCIYTAYHMGHLAEVDDDPGSKLIAHMARDGFSGCDCIKIVLDGDMRIVLRGPRPYDPVADEEEMEELYCECEDAYSESQR